MKYRESVGLHLPEYGNYSEVESTATTIFNWKYDAEENELVNLYEKSKKFSWNPTTDIDWSVDVDMERIIHNRQARNQNQKLIMKTPDSISNELYEKMVIERNAYTISQFLHGEQGGILGCSKLVQVCPDMAAKYFSATQALDEIKHAETYKRYLTEKIENNYPVRSILKELFDEILSVSEWDISLIGMQIMVEGLALGSFPLMKASNFDEPLIQQITSKIMMDESRHVAFGVKMLEDVYKDGLTERELKVREEFVIESSLILSKGMSAAEPITERLGLEKNAAVQDWFQNSPFLKAANVVAFSKIVPNLKRIGLLTDRVRSVFTDLGVIQYEDFPDCIDDPNPTPSKEAVGLLVKYIQNH